MKLLLIENDPRARAPLGRALNRYGFDVLRAYDAERGVRLLATRPDIVLLDLALPDHDGFALCARLRRLSHVPIIAIAARTDVASGVRAVHIGADDYLVKPYPLVELVARVHAVTRRALQPPDGTHAAVAVREFGPLRLDAGARTVTVDGRPVTLTRKEFHLLALLASRPGAVFRRDQLIRTVWHTDWAGTARTLEVHIASVRRKLGLPGIIRTVRGVGYLLAPPGCR